MLLGRVLKRRPVKVAGARAGKPAPRIRGIRVRVMPQGCARGPFGDLGCL